MQASDSTSASDDFGSELPPLRLVMGMSRGGTTSVLRALNLRGDVIAFGETGFWSLSEANPKSGILDRAAIDRLAEIYRPVHLVPVQDGKGSIELSQEELTRTIAEGIASVPAPADNVTVFRAFGDAVAKATGRRFWVEKTPHHMLHVDHIIACDPAARIIVMLRSPEEFLNSYKHQGDRKPTAARRNFHRLYHPALASLVCRGYLKAALTAKRRYPRNVAIIKLEDIRQDEETVLSKVVNHFRLPADRPTSFPISNSSFAGGAQRSKLSSVELLWLRLIAGRAARALRYEIRKSPGRSGQLIGSVLRLLAWPVINLQLLFTLRAGPYAMARRWLR